MAKMSDKVKRAINKGRRKAGLKPIPFDKENKEKKGKKSKKSLPKLVPKRKMGMIATDNEFYQEYKRLGGKKTRAKYKTLLKKFYDHTLEIFSGAGDPRYKTRNEALYGFKKSAKIDNKEVNRIFDSVNNIHAYT